MSSKTLYATAEAEDLTDDGHGRIRILTEHPNRHAPPAPTKYHSSERKGSIMSGRDRANQAATIREIRTRGLESLRGSGDSASKAKAEEEAKRLFREAGGKKK